MYWNPFDSAHSGRINSSSGWAAILGFILAGRLWVVGFFFFLTAGGTRVQAVIEQIVAFCSELQRFLANCGVLRRNAANCSELRKYHHGVSVNLWKFFGIGKIAISHLTNLFKGGLTFCSELRRFAANCGVLRRFAANCGKLQRFAANCGELWRFAAFCGVLQHFAAFYGVLRRFAAFCSFLRRIAANCGGRFAAFCSFLQRFAAVHGPGLVVLAPIEGIFSNLLSFLSFALFGRYLLPVLILLLFL